MLRVSTGSQTGAAACRAKKFGKRFSLFVPELSIRLKSSVSKVFSLQLIVKSIMLSDGLPSIQPNGPKSPSTVETYTAEPAINDKEQAV